MGNCQPIQHLSLDPLPYKDIRAGPTNAAGADTSTTTSSLISHRHPFIQILVHQVGPITSFRDQHQHPTPLVQVLPLRLHRPCEALREI